MAAKELLFDLYKSFLERKEVLSEAPRLSLAPLYIEKLDIAVAEEEMAMMISYLLGVKDVRQMDFKEALDIVQKYYESQPDWKELILAYFEYLTLKEEEKLEQMEEEICQEIEQISQDILNKSKQWSTFAEKRIQELTQQNFPIDCQTLVFNYLEKFVDDPQKAKEILSSNPLSLTTVTSTLTEEEKNKLNEQLKAYCAGLNWDA